MASFLEELWNSVFIPGPTPTLLIATNASFAALQLLLLALLVATYSVHFLVLSVLSGGLWYAINWFARELQVAQEKENLTKESHREKSLDPDSETETESVPAPTDTSIDDNVEPVSTSQTSSSAHLTKPLINEELRKRRSLGDSSDYLSTDSEWEKISEG